MKAKEYIKKSHRSYVIYYYNFGSSKKVEILRQEGARADEYKSLFVI